MSGDTITSHPGRGHHPLRVHHALHRVFPAESTLVLRPGATPIGREGSDRGVVCPDDAAMSRDHATLTLAGSRVRLEDRDSYNGTFRNGIRVARSVLDDGDVVRCGNSFFVYRVEPVEIDDASFPALIGRSPVMRRLRGMLARVAAEPVTVVLLGETGTGKTIAARAIHARSERRGEFVHVNGGAIPDTVADSLLFGHCVGAFTDARSDHPGWFRSAHRGTLFLDEVALLTSTTQGRLLTTIESRAVTPIGSKTPVAVDVRLIVATNEDLRAAVDEGRFRADLYARLAEISVLLPPLRARREDVLPLLRAALGGNTPLDPDLVDVLLNWHWPLNVREVEKVAIELRIRGEGASSYGAHHVEGRLTGPAGGSGPEPHARQTGPAGNPPSRSDLEAMLRSVDGNVAGLARRVGRSTKQVYRWCNRHGLDPASFRRTVGSGSSP